MVLKFFAHKGRQIADVPMKIIKSNIQIEGCSAQSLEIILHLILIKQTVYILIGCLF